MMQSRLARMQTEINTTVVKASKQVKILETKEPLRQVQTVRIVEPAPNPKFSKLKAKIDEIKFDDEIDQMF